MTISKGLLLLLAAGFISAFLSITVDMSHYELGALINYFWPPILTTLGIIIFIITCWISKQITIRLLVLGLLCLYLLYIGLALHFAKDYWPLVLW